MWEHAEPAASSLGRMFGSEQGSTPPFAAQTDALPEAQQAEQGGGSPAHQFVAGQHADQHGGRAHHQQRNHQCRLAAYFVAKVSEYHCAYRSGNEGDAEGEERVQRLHCRVAVGKEYRSYHHRHGKAVDVKIVKLDGRADETGKSDAQDGRRGVSH